MISSQTVSLVNTATAVGGGSGALCSPANSGLSDGVGLALFAPANSNSRGCWVAKADGGLITYGDAPFLGRAPVPADQEATGASGIAATPSRNGYWIVGRDGGVTSSTHPSSQFWGSAQSKPGDPPIPGLTPDRLNRLAVWRAFRELRGNSVMWMTGIIPTTSGDGYWLIDNWGNALPFGDAGDYSDMARATGANFDDWRARAEAFQVRIVGGGATATGGYWLADSQGGVFTFGPGGTPFFGSLGGAPTAAEIISMVVTPTRLGYYLVAKDGRVATFGDAQSSPLLSTPVKANDIYVGMAGTPSGGGYWTVGADGGVFAFGDAQFRGSLGDKKLNNAIVGVARRPQNDGYWLVGADGGVFTFGNAPFKGSLGDTKLNKPILGILATHTGNGYWLFATDGGVFAFGDAQFFGSLPGLGIEVGGTGQPKPIVGMTARPNSDGYWLVGGEGKLYRFGNAQSFGDMTGGGPPQNPVVGIASTKSGNGYWILAADGGIFTYGDATTHFYGSAADTPLAGRIEAMVRTDSGNGYWLIGSDGGVFSFGDAQFVGVGPVASTGPIGFREIIGGGNPSMLNCGSCHGDPVDSSTGSLFETYTDLAAPGRGPGVSVTRSYSSARAAEKTAFGYGWTAPEFSKIEVGTDDSDGNQRKLATVTQENGSVVTFVCDGPTKQWVAAKRVFATLVQTTASSGSDCSKSSTGFVLARTGREKLSFDGAGRMVSLVDAHGYAMTLTRDSNGRVTQVLNGSGKGVVYTYDGSGRVATAADVGAGLLGRLVTYAYDSADNLIAVFDVRDGLSRFCYDTKHRLVGKMSPRLTALYPGATCGDGSPWFVSSFDDWDRVIWQKDQVGNITRWSYEDGLRQGGSQTGVLTVTDPANTETVETFDQGRLTRKVEAVGSTVEVTTEYTYDPDTLAKTKMVVKGSGANPDQSSRTTAWGYDENGNVTSETTPDGQTSTRYYTPFSELGRAKAADDVSSVTTYDTRGNPVKQMTTPTPPTYWSQLIADNTGLCLGPEVAWDAATTSTKITQQNCADSNNLSLRIVAGTARRGAQLASPGSTNLCLAGGSGEADPQAVSLAACDNTKVVQQWDLVPIGNTLRIVNLASGKCLDVKGPSTSVGALLQTWSCAGLSQTNQLFRY